MCAVQVSSCGGHVREHVASNWEIDWSEIEIISRIGGGALHALPDSFHPTSLFNLKPAVLPVLADINSLIAAFDVPR
jgi:hypothetical protein